MHEFCNEKWHVITSDITCCRDFLPFSHNGISEVNNWCEAIRSGSKSAFQYISKWWMELKSGICAGDFFYTKLGKTFLCGAALCTGTLLTFPVST